MINIKKTVSATILTATVLASCPMVMADGISVVLDGQELSFDVAPRIISDYTLVPMRTIFESLGYDVVWRENDSSVTAYNSESSRVIRLVIGQDHMEVYDYSAADVDYAYLYAIQHKDDTSHWLQLPVAPMIDNGTTLIPLRAISEVSGCNVSWDGDMRLVSIVTPENGQVLYTNIDNLVAEIQYNIDNGLYLEAIQLCDQTLQNGDYFLSVDSISMLNTLKTTAQNAYNDYVENHTEQQLKDKVASLTREQKTIMCDKIKIYIENRLKYPAMAKWPDVESEDVQYMCMTEDTITVVYKMLASNAYGVYDYVRGVFTFDNSFNMTNALLP